MPSTQASIISIGLKWILLPPQKEIFHPRVGCIVSFGVGSLLGWVRGCCAPVPGHEERHWPGGCGGPGCQRYRPRMRSFWWQSSVMLSAGDATAWGLKEGWPITVALIRMNWLLLF